MKGAGVLLILLGALLCAHRATGRLRERVRALESLEQTLRLCAGELAFRLTPIPRLCGRLGERTGAGGALFHQVAEGLSQDPEGGLRKSWTQAVDHTQSALNPEEKLVLTALGDVLGRYDSGEQVRELEQAAARLGEFRQTAAEEQRRLSRVYCALSLAGGLGLALVLI